MRVFSLSFHDEVFSQKRLDIAFKMLYQTFQPYMALIIKRQASVGILFKWSFMQGKIQWMMLSGTYQLLSALEVRNARVPATKGEFNPSGILQPPKVRDHRLLSFLILRGNEPGKGDAHGYCAHSRPYSFFWNNCSDILNKCSPEAFLEYLCSPLNWEGIVISNTIHENIL